MEVLEAMPDDVITLIRRHDPATHLRPLPSADATAMRGRILRSAVPRTSSRRRRRPLVLAAAVAVAALAGAATVYSSIPGDDHAPSVNRQFAAITKTIDLPPGAHWRPLHLPADVLYGRRFALIAAIGQAQCAWYANCEFGRRRGQRRGRAALICRGVDAAADDAAAPRRRVRGCRRLRQELAAGHRSRDRRRPSRRLHLARAVPAGELWLVNNGARHRYSRGRRW